MEIAIEQAKKGDLPVIIEIANTYLGKDYLTSTLSESLDNKDYLLKVAKLANCKIVGFVLYQFKKDELIIKSIAVNPLFIKKGIATLLITNAVEYIAKMNYKKIKIIAWKKEQGIIGILSRLKFQQKEKLSNYWKQDSLEKGYNCPTCGAPPCLCSAIVFEKQL